MMTPTESEPDAPDPNEGGESEYETATVPMAVMGGDVKPGQTVSMKVMSVNEDDGTVDICCAPRGTKSGIKAMASKFDSQETA